MITDPKILKFCDETWEISKAIAERDQYFRSVAYCLKHDSSHATSVDLQMLMDAGIDIHVELPKVGQMLSAYAIVLLSWGFELDKSLKDREINEIFEMIEVAGSVDNLPGEYALSQIVAFAWGPHFERVSQCRRIGNLIAYQDKPPGGLLPVKNPMIAPWEWVSWEKETVSGKGN